MQLVVFFPPLIALLLPPLLHFPEQSWRAGPREGITPGRDPFLFLAGEVFMRVDVGDIFPKPLSMEGR